MDDDSIIPVLPRSGGFKNYGSVILEVVAGGQDCGGNNAGANGSEVNGYKKVDDNSISSVGAQGFSIGWGENLSGFEVLDCR